MPDPSFFPTQSAILSQQAIADQLLCKYSFYSNTKTKVYFFHRGLNDTYVVNSGNNIYYLRISRYNWRSAKDLQAEVDLLVDLKQYDLSAIMPVPMTNGTYIHRIEAPEGIRYGILFTSAKGTSLKLEKVKEMQSFGNFIGRFHQSTTHLSKKYDRFELDWEYLLETPLNLVNAYVSDQSDQLPYLIEVGEAIMDKVESLLVKDLPEYGICHGDLHPSNIHSDEDGRMTLFDFDCFGYGWRAYDLSAVKWHQLWHSGKNKNKTHRLWESFLEGYSQTSSLTEYELEAIYYFVPVRHIWLMGIQLYGNKDWGLNSITHDYLDHNVQFIQKFVDQHF